MAQSDKNMEPGHIRVDPDGQEIRDLPATDGVLSRGQYEQTAAELSYCDQTLAKVRLDNYQSPPKGKEDRTKGRGGEETLAKVREAAIYVNEPQTPVLTGPDTSLDGQTCTGYIRSKSSDEATANIGIYANYMNPNKQLTATSGERYSGSPGQTTTSGVIVRREPRKKRSASVPDPTLSTENSSRKGQFRSRVTSDETHDQSRPRDSYNPHLKHTHMFDGSKKKQKVRRQAAPTVGLYTGLKGIITGPGVVAAPHLQQTQPSYRNHRNVVISSITGPARIEEICDFTINTTTAGSAVPDVRVVPPTGTNLENVEVVSIEADVYRCTFTPETTGKHMIMVCFGGMNVPGSPLEVDVSGSDDTIGNTVGDSAESGNLRQRQVHQTRSDATIRESTDLATLRSTVPADILESIKSALTESTLKLGNTIGEGQFGAVWEARLTGSDGESRLVAAKTIKDDSLMVDLLKEAAIMKDLKHRNILPLLGVKLLNVKPYLLTPLMKPGNLKVFLNKPPHERPSLTVSMLLRFGLDVASGMEHLASLKFVHRDLAARNCLLGEDWGVRICDFGFARDNLHSDYVMASTMKKLPVRWVAPEVFQNMTFTTATDVWAFGVTLWEVLSLHIEPYSHISNNLFIRAYLENGQRLPRPEHTTDSVYTLMLACWHQDPDKRPDFCEIRSDLERSLADVDQLAVYI